MAKFITSIELFGADESDYQNLTSALEKESFRPEKKKYVSLKRVEYNREGNITLKDVTDAVFKVAKSTGKKYSFTIIKDKNLN